MTRQPAQLRGFTLIELILVLVIISITLALAAPSLRGWGQGQKLRNAADSFIAATGYARGLAVSTAKPHVVEIDSSANTFVVQRVEVDGSRKPVNGDMGQPVTLPTDYTIRLVTGGGSGAVTEGVATGGAASIVFYPDSRNTPATVELKASNGDIIQLASESPADPFRKVEAPK